MSESPARTDTVDLKSLFVSAFDKFGATCAVVEESGARTSYAELGARANQLAHFFADSGVAAGDAVAIMLPNCTEFVVADQACIRAGAAKVAVNSMLSADEQAHVLKASGARIAVVSGSQLHAAQRARAADDRLEVIILVGEAPGEAPGAAPDTAPDAAPVLPWGQALAGRPASLPGAVSAGSAMGRMSFTGGTTGLPKAIVHVNERIALNLLSHVLEMELGDDEQMLLTTPLAHAAGLFMQAALLRGGTVHLGSGFDVDAVVERIRRERITYLFLVPTMLNRLLDELQADGGDLPSVRTILYGAAPVDAKRLLQGMSLFGEVFIQFYGQAEAPNFITRLGRREHTAAQNRPELLTSCGRAVTMAHVRIVDADGRTVPEREVGEVVVRTPYTMTRYAANQDATAEALRNGWLHTGDLGWVDGDGYVHLVDRAKDMVITGGLNVYCREVERAISVLEPVADVAVFGLPDDDWGEVVAAAVVPVAGAHLDLEWIRTEISDSLSRYKLPKVLRLMDSLPLTGVGKHDKKALRRASQQ
jgi:fatty-acyl-CoA synthase/long-chain acyl-CoA synthetase